MELGCSCFFCVFNSFSFFFFSFNLSTLGFDVVGCGQDYKQFQGLLNWGWMPLTEYEQRVGWQVAIINCKLRPLVIRKLCKRRLRSWWVDKYTYFSSLPDMCFSFSVLAAITRLRVNSHHTNYHISKRRPACIDNHPWKKLISWGPQSWFDELEVQWQLHPPKWYGLHKVSTVLKRFMHN